MIRAPTGSGSGRGRVQVLVFGDTISPIFGGVEISARACGPSTTSPLWLDVAGAEVATGPVPSGGTAYVFLTCRMSPQIIGGFGIPGLDAERLLVGVATIDPFRSRSGA